MVGSAFSARVLELCAALALVACTAPAPSSAAAPQQELRVVPLGLCEDHPEETRSLAGVRRDLEMLRATGARVLRISMGWDSLEPEKDRYDFAFWDAVVRMAVDEYDLTLIPYVAYTPQWNSDGSPEEFWKTPPRDLEEFAEIVRLLVERYRGRIRSWELWNEPDNRDYWLGSTEDYAKLLRAGAGAVRAADPRGQVVLGGLAGGVEFLEELFDEWKAAESLDVVNLHSYYETWNPEPLETIPEYVDRVSAIIDRHGGKQAVWMAEVGYSNFRRGAEVSKHTFARFDYEHTLEFQATALVRTLTLLFSRPAVELVAWYELKDPAATDAMIGDVNNRHLGLAFSDYRPKPALTAFTFMGRLFAGGFRSLESELRVFGARSSPRQVHGFLTSRGTVLVIAWLPTHTGPAVPQAGAGNAPDRRRESVRVQVPYAVRGDVTAFDALGRVLGTSAPSINAPSHTEISLVLSGGNVVIAEVALR